MSPSNSCKTTKFCSIWHKFRVWIRYNFCFCKGVLFASGLVFSDTLIEYSILAILITYLVQKELTNAAILVMIQEAISALLGIVMIFISDALFGRFLVISFSSLFYVIGLVLLYHGSRKSRRSRLDVSGILLLAVGQAGVKPLIREFIVEQYTNHEPDQGNPNEDRVIARKNVWCRIVWVFSAVAAFLTYKYIFLWKKTFEISAWTTGGSLILFLCGSTRFYHSRVLADTGSRLTAIFHDLKAFLVNVKRRNRNQDDDTTYLNIREQDKDSSPGLEERKMERKEKLKYFQKMGCMWTTFLLFGLILSAGKIFFPYQGESAKNPRLLLLLVVIQSISRKVISFLFELLLKWVPEDKQRKAKLVRICIGMMLSIPCFLVAWRVEVLRLRKFTLESEPTVSIFHLVPQFCILGLMEGLAQDGLDEFMIDMFPKSRKDYVSATNTFVIGLGNFGNVLCYRYGNSLFVDMTTENTTRMDKYFIILTIVGSVNLCYYSGISILFYYRSKKTTKSPRVATSDGNTPQKDENSQIADLECNTAKGDNGMPQSIGLAVNGAGEEDHKKSKNPI